LFDDFGVLEVTFQSGVDAKLSADGHFGNVEAEEVRVGGQQVAQRDVLGRDDGSTGVTALESVVLVAGESDSFTGGGSDSVRIGTI
jgi:hypothetical protein